MASAGPQSSRIPRLTTGNDWLHHPNLEAELRRLLRGTNSLAVILSDSALSISFGYLVCDGPGRPYLFMPSWEINNAAEGAAVITEVMKVCGPVLKDIKVNLMIDVKGTTSNQLVSDQEEPEQQMRQQWLRDFARITLKTTSIGLQCNDKALWDDFVRFFTSRNETSDGSKYPWPDLQILQLCSDEADLLRYGQETLVTYLAETETHPGEAAPALSRLNVPGSFYRSADAEIPQPELLIKSSKPRAEDDDAIDSVSGSILCIFILTLL